MKINTKKWSILLVCVIIAQLVLSAIHLSDFQTKFSHHPNETILKQQDSNSQAIEETESLFVLIEETTEEIELNDFSYSLAHVTNFSSTAWFAVHQNLNSKNFALTPYSPPEKVS
jgi:hypothetical protein